MVNGHVALAFEELATLLELQGESPFKIRAYRAFADVARTLREPLADIDARGELEKMHGVGKAIAGKVRELVAKGEMDRLERARREVPGTLRDLLRVESLGPARVRKVWQELGVTNLPALVDACKDGRVEKLFGAKVTPKIAASAEAQLATIGRVLLAQALFQASWVIPRLVEQGTKKVRTVGSVRRGHEIVEELAIVVADLSEAEIDAALASGARKIAPFLYVPNGVELPKIRVRATPFDRFVETVLVETGSAAHVAALEARAKAKGATLAEVCAKAADEEAVYAALDLAFVPPELREEGAFDVPAQLLPVRGVLGVFHVHTTWSDGVGSIEEMARAALDAGYAYVGISDHSRAASYANGLDPDRLQKQVDEIEAARKAVPGIEILHGIEVDVMDDGTLDLPDDVLAKLDFVVASVHANFNLDRAAMTKRIVRAVSHPLVTILGHPTGRLLLGRHGYEIDIEAIAAAAAKSGVALEINASPQRLDLSPAMIRAAAERGASFCINPDAHEPRGFLDVPLGVSQARRAALRVDQVLNARDRSSILEALRARRAKGAKALGVAV